MFKKYGISHLTNNSSPSKTELADELLAIWNANKPILVSVEPTKQNETSF